MLVISNTDARTIVQAAERLRGKIVGNLRELNTFRRLCQVASKIKRKQNDKENKI